MKVSLGLKEGVSILAVEGAVDMHNFVVLKAGVTKIFRDGKNRIALDFTKAEKIDTEVIREIAILDILARELAGRIALVVNGAELKQQIVSFSRPPVVPIFDSEAQMLEYFSKAGKEDAEDPAKSAVVGKVDASKELKEKDKEIEALKAQLAQLDKGEVQKQKQEAAAANSQYKTLLVQLKELMLERRKPVVESIAIDQIAALKGEIADLTDRIKGLTKGAG